MLPKALYLTSHTSMSGCRWVTMPAWSSGSLRPFSYNSSVYSCHLYLISSASIRYLRILSFILPIIARNFPLVSLIFLKRSLVFPFYCFSLFLCIDHLGQLFLSLLAIFWNSAFRWVYLSFCTLPLASFLFFLHFFFLRMILVTTSCTMLQSSIHISPGTLIRSTSLNLFVTSTVYS